VSERLNWLNLSCSLECKHLENTLERWYENRRKRMALAVTASFVESCQVDISWPSAGGLYSPQRYWIAVRDGYDKREWITETAAAGLKYGLGMSRRVQLNLSEFRSSSSSYDVSVKGNMSSSSTSEVEGILACKVVQSGSQSVAVSVDRAIGLLSLAASAKSGETYY